MTISKRLPHNHQASSSNGNLSQMGKRQLPAEFKAAAMADAGSGLIPRDDAFGMNFKDIPIRQLLDYFLQTKDPAAWQEFQNRLSPDVRRVIASRLRRWRPNLSIDDFEQDTYLKLIINDYKYLRAFTWPDDNAIIRYVRAVAANVVFDFFRSSHNRIFLNPEDIEVLTSHVSNIHESPYLGLRIEEIDKCLHSCISKKDPREYRALFWLYHRWGFTAKQIACLPCNLSTKKVENVLQKLTRCVRDKLGKRAKGSSPE